jgi:two-component system chemotaxis response regulator CheB
MTSTRPIRVLIIDDSALMRAMIRKTLESDPGIEVVDAAGSGPVALDKIKQLRPDVATLDVEMPGMDGIEILRRIMVESPTPVVMLSAHTFDGAERTLEALEAGAIDYVAKPSGEKGANIRDVAIILAEKIRAAAAANLNRIRSSPARAQPARAAPVVKPSVTRPLPQSAGDVSPLIAIGISCGGPATLVEIFPDIPADCPPIVLTQHMPPKFTKSLADRLDRMSAVNVKEAESGDVIQRGHVYIAPGEAHLVVIGKPGRLRIKLDAGQKACGHRPAADVMFRSVVSACGSMCVGAIMTGMGNDGAEALGVIKAAGGGTIAQDQDTCVVYGMPKAAADLGHAQHIVPADRVIPTAIELCRAHAVS